MISVVTLVWAAASSRSAAAAESKGWQSNQITRSLDTNASRPLVLDSPTICWLASDSLKIFLAVDVPEQLLKFLHVL